jgi:hypothetical protein
MENKSREIPARQKKKQPLLRTNIKLARKLWPGVLARHQISALKALTAEFLLSIVDGEVTLIDGCWFVTHTGLMRLSLRNRCQGIRTEPIAEFCDSNSSRYCFKATVYKSPHCKGFVGYGDADPSNVSPLVHGAEMRVAETRAVNRALRKAYGIGICSVEEIGSFSGPGEPRSELKRLPPQSASANGRSNGSPRVRDHLCQIIRQHQLDPVLVKSYAVDFCGTKTLREATREQVENFVAHLANWAEKDRNALLCQLNSYLGVKDGAA